MGCALGVPFAKAADLPVKAAPFVRAEPSPSWTGWYGGGSIGYATGNVTRGTPSFPQTENLEPDSFVGILHAGFDYQFPGNWVVGARVSVPFFSLDDQTPGPNPGFPFAAEVKHAVIVSGRLGYAFGPWLPYVFGGGVWGEGEARVVNVGSVTADHTGYIIGFGAEYRLSRYWSIEANYSFISMEKETYNFVPLGGSAVVHGFESHNFMIGANFRWGAWLPW
jgi:high affinity Mn2+ porin